MTLQVQHLLTSIVTADTEEVEVPALFIQLINTLRLASKADLRSLFDLYTARDPTNEKIRSDSY